MSAIFKSCCLIWNPWSRICLNGKIHAKRKNCKFGTKNVLFSCFCAESLKAIVIFETSTLEFVQVQFSRKTKQTKIKWNLGPNQSLIGKDLFRQRRASFENQHQCNQHYFTSVPQIFSNPKFRPKQRAKTSSLGAKVSYLGIFRLQLKSVCHILNLHLRTCQIAKIHAKLKALNLEQKVPRLDNFELPFWKIMVLIFEISTLEFIKKWISH